nr:putative leucine-rich repeat receptor-like serine/threonine-protein kinase [Quercus suber]
MIRFHWAGKGTTAAPNKGIYGPLVSAISTESDFSPPVDSKIVVGVVVSVLLLIFMILGILWWKGCMGGRISREKELRGLDLQTDRGRWFWISLQGPAGGRLKLDCPARQKICAGIARGLAFLHEESTLKIVHRDIKSTNILLDGDFNPKISDFGLAKLYEEENTHISTRIAGTMLQ